MWTSPGIWLNRLRWNRFPISRYPFQGIPVGFKGIPILFQNGIKIIHGEFKTVFSCQLDKFGYGEAIIILNTEIPVIRTFVQKIQNTLS